MKIPPRSLNETENDCLDAAADPRRLTLAGFCSDTKKGRGEKVTVCWSECSVTLVVTSQNARHITEEIQRGKFFDGLSDLKSDPTATGSQQVIAKQE